ncbi:unnamed protein product [Calypogeia fissa]
MMAMRNPPPPKFSYPTPPAVSFDVSEAFKRHQDRLMPTFMSEQIAFYKNAIARLKEKIDSADTEFLALITGSASRSSPRPANTLSLHPPSGDKIQRCITR